MAYLWAESLFKLIKPQARPIIVEEAQEYIERGSKNANDRTWWPLRSMLRSLSLFCNDEQIAERKGLNKQAFRSVWTQLSKDSGLPARGPGGVS